MIAPKVVQAQTLANHELAVTFADGQKRKFSMLPYLQYPAFAALKDVALFKRARVAHGTVVWNDEIDISPDTLYIAGNPD
jgi:hypothetical protein